MKGMFWARVRKRAPMIAPASSLVLFNKNIANFTHKRWENQCSKSFGFCDRTFS